jgi:hypothetical protein
MRKVSWRVCGWALRCRDKNYLSDGGLFGLLNMYTGALVLFHQIKNSVVGTKELGNNQILEILAT